LTRTEDDRRLLVTALGVAIVLHLSILLLVALPEAKTPIVAAAPQCEAPVITFVIPPPPPPERPRGPTRPASDRLVPAPDPVPDRLEPVPEPVGEAIEPAASAELDDVIGDPGALPETTPFELTDPTIRPPTLIASSKVDPVYPELGRVARRAGRVTLRAVIAEDGSVGEIEVLDCKPTGYGFDQAAVEAVMQWRYRPAARHGVPVPVFLIVEVTFTLR
jgi:protein TonB